MTITRRSFLTSSGTALVAAACAPSLVARSNDYDLVIRGGTLFDGTGAPGSALDLAIANGRIAAIAPRIAERGREEIDARGLVVAPGFVDIHSHGDGTLTEDPRAESVIRQGITTIVVGADGGSRANGTPEKSFAAHFDSVDALRPGPNVASMVGLGTVRGAVIGDADRQATPDELTRMTAMVESALRDGV